MRKKTQIKILFLFFFFVRSETETEREERWEIRIVKERRGTQGFALQEVRRCVGLTPFKGTYRRSDVDLGPDFGLGRAPP